MIQEKQIGLNEEGIIETKAYLKSKEKSSYKKGIEKLEEHWHEYTLWLF